MGKSSLTQSTEKKTGTKKTASKKTVKADSAKKSPSKKSGTTKTPKAKSTSKAKPRKTTGKKASAEKAAAEKAAAEKAAAEVKVTYEPPPPPPPVEPSDPSDKLMKFGIAGFSALILILIMVSFSNTHNYYLKTDDGAVEIWQGKFSPMGSERIVLLPGIQYSEPIQPVYSREDVYPLTFNYYVDKADMLLDVPGLPDFEGINKYLNKAGDFVINSEMQNALNARLNGIEVMTLVYKADVAASKERLPDLETAVALLKKAEKIAADESSAKMIREKIAAADMIIQTLQEAETQQTESATEQ